MLSVVVVGFNDIKVENNLHVFFFQDWSDSLHQTSVPVLQAAGVVEFQIVFRVGS